MHIWNWWLNQESVSWGAAELREETVLWLHPGMEVVRRAVHWGAIDGVDAGGVFNRGQSTAGFLCKEESLEFMFTLCVQKGQAFSALACSTLNVWQ